MRAIWPPLITRSVTVATASCSVGNAQLAAATLDGSGCSRSVSSVMMPSVPSAPIIRCSRSKPADDLRARVPRRTSVPSASATSIAITLCCIEP